jgi:hypothetical protein
MERLPADIEIYVPVESFDSNVHTRGNYTFRMWSQLSAINIRVYEFLSPNYITPITLLVTDCLDHSMVIKFLTDSEYRLLKYPDEQYFVASVLSELCRPSKHTESSCRVYYAAGMDILGRCWLFNTFAKPSNKIKMFIGR